MSKSNNMSDIVIEQVDLNSISSDDEKVPNDEGEYIEMCKDFKERMEVKRNYIKKLQKGICHLYGTIKTLDILLDNRLDEGTPEICLMEVLRQESSELIDMLLNDRPNEED